MRAAQHAPRDAVPAGVSSGLDCVRQAVTKGRAARFTASLHHGELPGLRLRRPWRSCTCIRSSTYGHISRGVGTLGVSRRVRWGCPGGVLVPRDSFVLGALHHLLV
jgi:hypothetical protein